MSGSLKNVFIFLRQFFITVFHVIMIICISLYHDHKSSWISSHVRSNSRFDILSLRGFDILSLRSVYENHQSQSIKWANSLDQMTSVFSFKSQNRHPFILCIYIVSSSPCWYQLSFQFHINLTKAVFCHKKNRSFRSLTTL